MDAKLFSNSVMVGALMIAFGGLLLLGTFGWDDENAFRFAPSLFTLWGVLVLVQRGFRRWGFPLTLIAIGIAWQILVFVDLNVFPLALMAIGAALIFGGFKSNRSRSNRTSEPVIETENYDSPNLHGVTVMAENSRRIDSKEFSGGDMKVVMGSGKLDLRDAQIPNPPARVDLTLVMGEIKVRVPTDWNVEFDNATIMGETKDVRPLSTERATEPNLVITGSVVMGGLTIDG